VWGRKFTLITDHQPLKLLKDSKRHTQRGNKWYLELQDYQFNVEHRAGKKIPHVDALSRYPCDTNENHDNESEEELEIEFDETDPADDLYADEELNVIYLENQDPNIYEIVEQFEQFEDDENCNQKIRPEVMIIIPELAEVDKFDEPPIHDDVAQSEEGEDVSEKETIVTKWEPDFPIEKWGAAQRRCPELRTHYYTAANKPQQDLYVLDNDEVLYQKVEGKYLACVPIEFRRQIIRRYHDIPVSGHYGVEKTHQLMKQRLTFPRMKTEIFRHISACDVCQKYKHRRGQATLKLAQIPPFPFHTISMDVVGPLPTGRSGFKYVLVIQDVLTRWIEFIPMTRTDGPVTIKHAIRYMLRYGVPDRILTDCGSNFMGKLFEEMCRVFSTRHINTTPYRPQANGANERSHAALHRLFGILQRELKSVGHWPDYCPLITYIHNTVYHVTIKRSPYEALFGHPPPIKPFGLPEMDTDVTDDVNTFLDLRQESLRILTEAVRDTVITVRHTSLEYVNKNRKNPEYLVGDEILMRNDQAKLLVDRKWGPLFSNPQRITRVISDVAVETIDENGEKRTLHVDRIKKYKRQTFEKFENEKKLVRAVPEKYIQPANNHSCSGSMPIMFQPTQFIPVPEIKTAVGSSSSSPAVLPTAEKSSHTAPTILQSMAKAVRNKISGGKQTADSNISDRRQTRSMTRNK
jgi:transposase InsO family protein